MNEALKQNKVLLELILDFYKKRTGNSNFRVCEVLKASDSKNIEGDLEAHKKLNDEKGRCFSVSRETFKLKGISFDFYQTFLENLRCKKIILDYWTFPREPFDKSITGRWFKDNILIRVNDECYKKLKKELNKLKKESGIREGNLGKIEIFISEKYGIYKDDITKKPCYGIKRGRKELIYRLKDGSKDGTMLLKIWRHNNMAQLSKDIKEINNTFKKNLKIGKDLIMHRETGGYELNRDDYDIQFIE